MKLFYSWIWKWQHIDWLLQQNRIGQTSWRSTLCFAQIVWIIKWQINVIQHTRADNFNSIFHITNAKHCFRREFYRLFLFPQLFQIYLCNKFVIKLHIWMSHLHRRQSAFRSDPWTVSLTRQHFIIRLHGMVSKVYSVFICIYTNVAYCIRALVGWNTLNLNIFHTANSSIFLAAVEFIP